MKNLWVRLFSLSLLVLWMAACQQAPTKVYESEPVKTKAGVQIQKTTMIVDARSPFEYAAAHLNGAVSVQWTDFAQQEPPFLGLLDDDLFACARRLARQGIRPYTPVIVVGNGAQGHGEEGRVAWTLKYMGLQDVQFSSIDAFSLPLTREAPPAHENPELWKPVLDDTLIVDRNVFLNRVMKPGGSARPIVIDVRPEPEYLGQVSSAYKNAPDVGAINIPWTQFLDEHGQPKYSIAKRLQDVAIGKDKTIYVIDEMGVRSASVTLVLRELGFAHAANFAGGYMQLMKQK